MTIRLNLFFNDLIDTEADMWIDKTCDLELAAPKPKRQVEATCDKSRECKMGYRVANNANADVR